MDDHTFPIVERVVPRVVHRVTVYVSNSHSPAACRVGNRRLSHMIHIGSVHAPILEHPRGWFVVQRSRSGRKSRTPEPAKSHPRLVVNLDWNWNLNHDHIRAGQSLLRAKDWSRVFKCPHIDLKTFGCPGTDRGRVERGLMRVGTGRIAYICWI